MRSGPEKRKELRSSKPPRFQPRRHGGFCHGFGVGLSPISLFPGFVSLLVFFQNHPKNLAFRIIPGAEKADLLIALLRVSETKYNRFIFADTLTNDFALLIVPIERTPDLRFPQT